MKRIITMDRNKAIKRMTQLGCGMMITLIALVAVIPINIITGHYLHAFCNVLWIYIGIKLYKIHEEGLKISVTASSAVESQSKIINELSKIIAEKSNKKGLKTKAWLARDKDNSTYLYLENKPFKAESEWISRNFVLHVNEEEINGLNPKWEEEEPIELEIALTTMT